MNKPRILVFIDWYKPYYKAGGPVRSMVNLVEHLGDKVRFHIVTSDRDYMADVNEANVPADRWVMADRGEAVYYASPAGRTRSIWRRLIREGEWDVVYINGLYSVWSSILPLWMLRGSKVRRIVAVRGMLAAGPMQQGAFKKRLFLRVMTMLGCFRDVEFQATNNEEVADIRRWMGVDVKVHLVRNLPRRHPGHGLAPIEKHAGELRLVSLARIAEEKNTLFAITCLGGLKGRVRFDLYGTVYDQDYFAQCKAAIARLPRDITVEWHGQLPNEQVVSVLQGSHMLFMPSVGENFGHTMLESLLAGRPLVISDRTPWKALGSHAAGWDLPLEDQDAFRMVLQHAVDMGQDAYARLAQGALTLGRRYLDDPEPVEHTYQMFAR